MGPGGMNVHRHQRWVDEQQWRGRDGRPDYCEWCRRSIWFWRKRARMVWAFDPHRKFPNYGRYVWAHERCAQHMRADGLAK